MKVWLVEIFVYNLDDEYGYISRHYRESKVFDQKVKALNYLRDFKKGYKTNDKNRLLEFDRKYDVCPSGFCVEFHDECTITEIEL